MVYFGLNGLFFISVMTRMPSIRDALQVDPAQLGSVLLAASLGSISLVAFGGVLIARFGGRLMLHVSTGMFVTAFLLIALSTITGDLHWIALGMFLKGVSWVIGNVPLNVESAAVERAVGRTIMPQFHAMYSIGAVVGAWVGALLSNLGISVAVQIAALSILYLVIRIPSTKYTVLDSVVEPRERRRAKKAKTLETPRLNLSSKLRATGITLRHRLRTRGAGTALEPWFELRILLLGLLVMSAALSEGAANDWLGLAVVDGLGQSESTGAITLSIFLFAMTAIRLFGGRLIDGLGPVLVLRLAGVSTVLGVVIFVTAPVYGLAAAGVVLWGFGAALVFPIAVSTASAEPRKAATRVAVVTSFGSMAGIAFPPLLGMIGNVVGVRPSLLFVALAGLVLITFAFNARPVPATDSSLPDDDAPHRLEPRADIAG